MISKFFIERPVLANVLAILMVVIGAVCAAEAAGGAISQRRASDHFGDHSLPRRRRAHRGRHRRAADRAAGQRRRRHDLHAVLQCVRRQLFADRDVPNRHGHQLRAGTGAEPGVERARPTAAGGAGAGRDRAAEVDRDPAVRHADIARRPLRQPLPRQLCDHQSEGPSSRACPASATSTSSGLASIPCGCGSTPTSCRRARSPRKTSSMRSRARTSRWPPASSACRRRRARQPFQYTLDIAGRLDDVSQFENIVVKTESNGQMTHLRDVAPRRARGADLQPGFHAQRQAGGRHRHLSDAGGERARRRRRGRAPKWPSSRRPFRRG